MKKLKEILHSKYFYLFLLIISFIYSFIYLSIPKSSKLNINDDFIGIITNYKISGDLLTIELKGEEKIIGYYYFDTKDERDSFENIYELGDTVLLKGNYSIPKNNTVPNLFNYKKYLENKGIYYLTQIDSINKLKDNTNIFYMIKNLIIDYIDNYKSSSYLYAFILGNNDLINSEINTSYQENGISHLLAISGMHVSLLSAIILFLLSKFFNEDKSYLITILFLIFYMILTGCSPSVCRSVLLFSLLSINKLFKFEVKTINIFIIVFCILVIINPYLLFEIGFQFSFAISFYLILLSNKLNSNSYIKNLFIVSVISFFVSFPITIYYFNQINLLSIIFNLFFVSFVSFIIFPISLMSLIFPFLDNILFLLINIMENVSVLFDSIEFSKLIIVKPSFIWIVLYYLVLTVILFKNNKLSLCLFIILILFQFCSPVLFSKDYFIAIDVGQGDSALVNLNNKTILIDTGGKITYKKEEWQRRKVKSLTDNTLLPLFKSLGIRKIDYLILTHGDYDHMGEAINLVENFKVEKVIFNCGEFNDLENNLIKVLNKKKILYHSCIKELNIENNKLYFLNNKDYDNENDNSSVMYTEINNYKFLFMGDAGVEVEEDLIKKYNLKDIDVLKVGHHGSKTSSGEEFINEVNPKYSVISVGKKNRYGHPNHSVLNNLEDSKIYRTDQDGSIMFKINKDKLKMETCTP